MTLYVGTSGWHYAHWRGGFYPRSMPTGQWLDYYAHRFATVEINNAFYRLPAATTFAGWAATVPDDFVLAVKASRYLTHIRRLHDPEEPVQRLRDRMAGLGSKLGPVLLQLPPNLALDAAALGGTLKALAGIRIAVEFRHDSWYTPEIRGLLEEHQAALCLTDSRGRRTPLWNTAGWGYVRFHAGRGQPPSGYGRTALHNWAHHLADLWPPTADLYVYFNNDQFGCAPRDARRFSLAARQAGLCPTRVPPANETPTSSVA